MRLARCLLTFNHARPGDIIPLRILTNSPAIPGSLYLPRERLRVPVSVGLEFFDVPLSPLLSRIDGHGVAMLYVAMLCERRILFVSQHLSVLTSCTHAALALFQPLPWAHLFIPVLPSALLDRTQMPFPFLLGVTPSQYHSLNHDALGEVTLVALDDGYVACLNGAPPLVDLEGSHAGNGNSGVTSYAGPRIASVIAAARASTLAEQAQVNGSLAHSSWSGMHQGGETPLDLASIGPGFGQSGGSGDNESINQLSIGRRDSSAAVAAAAAAAAIRDGHIPAEHQGGGGPASQQPGSPAVLEAALSPFHVQHRCHTWDEGAVTARAHRRAYVDRTAKSRRREKERIDLLYHKQAGDGDGSGDGGADRPMLDVSVASAFDVNSSFGSMPGSPYKASVSAAGPLPSSTSNELHHQMAGTASLHVDLANMLSSQPGAAGPGSHSMRRRPASTRPKSLALSASYASSGSSDGAGSGGAGAVPLAKSLLSRTLRQRGADMISKALGGPGSDCPGARLAHEIRQVYARERKEGCFDEAALYAATLTFVAVVFGRAVDFVTVDGAIDAGVKAGAVTELPSHRLEARFAKEMFVQYCVRHDTIARIMHEAVEATALTEFVCDTYIHQLSLKAAANKVAQAGTSSVAPSQQPVIAALPGVHPITGRLSVVDLAMGLAACDGSNHQASIGASSSTLGRLSMNLSTVGSGGAGGGGQGTVGGGSQPGTASGPGSLLGGQASFSSIQRQVLAALQPHCESLLDYNSKDAGPGLAGTSHTVTTALQGVAFAASCAAATTYRPAPLPAMPVGDNNALILTAVRAMLNGATAAGVVLDEEQCPSSFVIKVAAAATHDPSLLHVVLGVLWARVNDCTDRNWQQGYKSLSLLYALLRVGSPRVLVLSLSYIPLLRFLMHPVKSMAVRAGAAAERLAGQLESHVYVQHANVLARAKRHPLSTPGLPVFKTSSSSVSASSAAITINAIGPLAAIGPREGAAMVARQAARVYQLLAVPRKWMVERAVAAGPALITNGSPLTAPFPYPLVTSQAVSAPASAALPVGWQPTTQQPAPPPVGHGDGVLNQHMDGGGGPSPVSTSPASSAGLIVRQPRAAVAPFAQVHQVAMPCMASSRSRALAALAAKHGVVDDRAIISRPSYVREEVRALKASSAASSAASGDTVVVHADAVPADIGGGWRPRSMADASRLPKTYAGSTHLTAPMLKVSSRTALTPTSMEVAQRQSVSPPPPPVVDTPLPPPTSLSLFIGAATATPPLSPPGPPATTAPLPPPSGLAQLPTIGSSASLSSSVHSGSSGSIFLDHVPPPADTALQAPSSLLSSHVVSLGRQSPDDNSTAVEAPLFQQQPIQIVGTAAIASSAMPPRPPRAPGTISSAGSASSAAQMQQLPEPASPPSLPPRLTAGSSLPRGANANTVPSPAPVKGPLPQQYHPMPSPEAAAAAAPLTPISPASDHVVILSSPPPSRPSLGIIPTDAEAGRISAYTGLATAVTGDSSSSSSASASSFSAQAYHQPAITSAVLSLSPIESEASNDVVASVGFTVNADASSMMTPPHLPRTRGGTSSSDAAPTVTAAGSAASPPLPVAADSSREDAGGRTRQLSHVVSAASTSSWSTSSESLASVTVAAHDVQGGSTNLPPAQPPASAGASAVPFRLTGAIDVTDSTGTMDDGDDDSDVEDRYSSGETPAAESEFAVPGVSIGPLPAASVPQRAVTPVHHVMPPPASARPRTMSSHSGGRPSLADVFAPLHERQAASARHLAGAGGAPGQSSSGTASASASARTSPALGALGIASGNGASHDGAGGGTSFRLPPAPVPPAEGLRASSQVSIQPPVSQQQAPAALSPRIPGRGQASESGSTAPTTAGAAPLDSAADPFALSPIHPVAHPMVAATPAPHQRMRLPSGAAAAAAAQSAVHPPSLSTAALPPAVAPPLTPSQDDPFGFHAVALRGLSFVSPPPQAVANAVRQAEPPGGSGGVPAPDDPFSFVFSPPPRMAGLSQQHHGAQHAQAGAAVSESGSTTMTSAPVVIGVDANPFDLFDLGSSASPGRSTSAPAPVAVSGSSTSA